MTWFAASIIIGMKRRDGKGAILVHENVILIEAKSAEEAHHIAVAEGEMHQGLDGGLTIGGHPADNVFAGVRKVLTVDTSAVGTKMDDPPKSGTEVTYSEFEVPDDETLQRLGRGESVDVRYVE